MKPPHTTEHVGQCVSSKASSSTDGTLDTALSNSNRAPYMLGRVWETVERFS